MQKHRDKKRCENAREIMDGEWDPVPERAWTQLPDLHCSPPPSCSGVRMQVGLPACPSTCLLARPALHETGSRTELAQESQQSRTTWQDLMARKWKTWQQLGSQSCSGQRGQQCALGAKCPGALLPLPSGCLWPRTPEPPWWSSDFP